MEYRSLRKVPPQFVDLLDAALFEAQNSRDTGRKVGAVIYDADFNIISRDHNRLPIGIRYTEERLTRNPDGKYMWLHHAERACIATCIREKAIQKAYGILVTMHPCENCAQAIVDVGFQQLVTRPPSFADARWRLGYQVAKEMLTESAVEVLTYSRELIRGRGKKLKKSGANLFVLPGAKRAEG